MTEKRRRQSWKTTKQTKTQGMRRGYVELREYG